MGRAICSEDCYVVFPFCQNLILKMQFSTFVFLGVAMLIVNIYAAPLSEERRGDECPSGWKEVNGFQKCYFYKLSDEEVHYLDANQFCQQPGVVGSRLFTPGSLDELKQVEAAMIPDSVAGGEKLYWTGYVEFGWQSDDPNNLVYAANAYPFELMPKELWGPNEPTDWLPSREPCTWGNGAGRGIGDWDCVSTGWAGHTIICEADWNVETSASKRGDANLMQNAQERGQANLMQKRKGGGDEEERR